MRRTERRFNIKELHHATIKKIRDVHSDNPTLKRHYCDIVLDDGVERKNVEFWGGGFDTLTGFPHGIFCPPVEGQQVCVMFLQGHYRNPIACFPLPFAMNRKYNDLYNKIVTEMDKDDIAVFHKSGSKILMKANGDIEIDPAVGGEVRLTSPGVSGKEAARKEDATLSNSTTDSAFWTGFLAHTHSGVTTGAGVSGPPAGLTSSLTGKINAGSSKTRIG